MPRPEDPVGSAPPPLLAVLVNTTLWLSALILLPSVQVIDQIIDEGNVFLHRLYPEQVSVLALVYIRSFYALVCFYVPIAAYNVGNIVVQPTYLPASKLQRTRIVINGVKVLFPFTAWAWNLLGLHFAVSAYITHRLDAGMPVAPWIMRFAIVAWETAAPLTLLVSLVVKFAIWPTALKTQSDTNVLKTHRALLQHNANVFMALSELVLLGGLPIRIEHSSLALLLGATYVFFTWAIRNVWSPRTGPAFIYFFMDTTLGAVHSTIALLALTAVLIVSYYLFYLIASYSQQYESGLLHLGLVAGVFTSVARFRD